MEAGHYTTISQNSIYANEAGGIALQYGANDSLRPPTLTSAVTQDGTTTVTGSLSGATPSTTYTIEIFGNPSSVVDEGQTYLGNTSVTTDSNGNATISTTVNAGADTDFTATATDASTNVGDTSQFSNDVTETSLGSNYVINTNANGPGSLSDAITYVNGAGGNLPVIFNIPVTDPGYNATTGVFTIVQGGLSVTVSGVTIDGSTETTYLGTTLTTGPDVEITGANFGFVASDDQADNLILNGAAEPLTLIGDGNTVHGCYIGTDYTGRVASPNNNANPVFSDVQVRGSQNLIGGSGAGQANIIAFASSYGIDVQKGTENTISQNSIYANAPAGIYLTGSANDALPAPALTSAVTEDGTTTVTGSLTGDTPSTKYTIEIFGNPSAAPGEGQTYLGNTSVTTDSSGNATISTSVNAGADTDFTATATDTSSADAGDTSVFSNDVTVSYPPLSIANTRVPAAPTGTQFATFTVTLAQANTVPVMVDYATADGTATAGTDYTATSGTLTIPAGATTGTIPVPITTGTSDASGLTFIMVLSNPVNASIGTGTGTCTITHDITPVAVSVTTLPQTTLVNSPTTFTSTVSSGFGPADVSGVQLNIGHTYLPASSLCLLYNGVSNLLYVYNSSGVQIGGYAPGSGNVITTPMGSLDCSQTTVTDSGNNLVIVWAVTPSTPLLGVQPVGLYANSPFDKSTGNVTFGNWTIVSGTSSIGNTSAIVNPGGNAVNAVFTVTLPSPAPAVTTFGYATSDGTGTAGTDYTAKTGTLTIPTGASTGTISVPVLPASDATGLTFNVTLGSPVNAAIGTATGTCTIAHDTAPVPVSVTTLPKTSGVNEASTLTSTVSDTAGSADIGAVQLNVGHLNTPSNLLSVLYAPSTNLLYVVNGGTSTGGFAPGTSHVITTPVGSLNCAQTTVTPSGNSLAITWAIAPGTPLLGAQPVSLYANSPHGKSAGTIAFGTWTIVPPSSIGNTSVVVNSGGSAVNAIFTVTLPSPAAVPASFSYATSDGTGIAGTDYTAKTGTVTIPVGSSTGTIPVLVLGASDATGLTFNVTISNPVNAGIGTATGTCTINHDSAPEAVSVTTLPLTSVVGTTETLTSTVSDPAGLTDIGAVQLNVGHTSSPSNSLSLLYVPSTHLLYVVNAGVNTGGFAPGSGNVITVPMGSLNCAQTTVTPNGDSLEIAWSIAPSAPLLGAQPVGLYANTPYDKSASGAFGTWTIVSGAANIGNTAVVVNSGGNTVNAVFTVTLPSVAAVATSFSYATSDGTGTAGTDYVAKSGTLTIPVGASTGTITVPVLGATDGPGLTFNVTIANPVNAVIGTATGTCTVNYDGAPIPVSVTTLPLTSQVGTAETLTSTIMDASGVGDIGGVQLNVGHTSSPSNSLTLTYVPSTNLLYVLNGGVPTGGFAPGSANVITTTMGSLDCSQTTVTVSGPNLIIAWAITPSTPLIGAQLVSLYANSPYNKSQGATTFGTWTITASGSPDAYSAYAAIKPSGHSS